MRVNGSIGGTPNSWTSEIHRVAWEFADFVHNAVNIKGFAPLSRSAGWSRELRWLHIGSDVAIYLASLLILAVALQAIRKRPRVPFVKLGWLLGAAIAFCGLSHLLEALLFWWPAYRLFGLVKGATALFSLAASVALVVLAPKLLALRSASEYHREITQRRKTELELRQVHAQLEGVIELRTAELASKNEEMEQFLNAVSHDLKSPVVTCLGLTAILREDVESGRAGELNDTINRIDRAVNRMKRLIDDLLNLSRIGKVRFELGDVNIKEIIDSVGEELESRLDEAGVVLRIEEGLPIVRGDTRWLAEIFENLINNAIKYGCDNPNPMITVGAVPGDEERLIFVRDNGRGIAAAHQAQLFQPFRRFRTDKEGSGLGLAIVKRIIGMHSGRVWVESEPGNGATFWVALPAAEKGQNHTNLARRDEKLINT
jgi:signal transduction histidine kinase